MKRIVLSLVVGALALTGAVWAPAALAQDPTPSCSSAQLALAEADRLHAAAVAADKASAVAEAADKAAADARAADEKAAELLVVAKGSGDTAYSGPFTADAPILSRPESEQSANDKIIIARLRAYLAAQAEADKTNAGALQVEADKTNAVELRRIAAETDADALKVKLDAAVKVAGEACRGQNIPPRPRDIDCDEVSRAEAQRILDADKADPHDLDVDGDGIACEVDQVRVVPRTSSGVDTGA